MLVQNAEIAAMFDQAAELVEIKFFAAGHIESVGENPLNGEIVCTRTVSRICGL